MRRIVVLVVVLGLILGIGFALLPSASHDVPSVVEAAITKTFAVKSVEINETILNSSDQAGRSKVVGPAIYQAPDRWQGPVAPSSPGASAPQNLLIGNDQYAEVSSSTSGSGQFQRQTARLTNENGLSPAKQQAFFALIEARTGTKFHPISKGWTFQLNLADGSAHEVGGTLELSHGYIAKVTIDEISAGQPIELSFTFSKLNRAPRVANPT